MFKVSQGELIECIKALLVGVPSQCFDEVDGEFFMTPGLFTDETPPHLVLIYCKKFRRGGMLFSKLLQLTEYYNSLTSASMNMVIQNFILDYQALLKSITVPTSLMKLTLVISPFINTLEYLVDLVESDHLGGWHLLQRLYEDALQTVEPNLIRLTSALFVDCYTTYLKFIEKWIFEGEWHQELFFKKHILQEDVFDRTSWSQSYSFDPLNAPSCLPAAVIYRCGMLFHLVRDRTSHIEAKGSPVDCRPKMKMITNKNEFAFMKQTCHHYSNTGEALRLEASQKCWKDHNVDLLMLAKETAEAECLKHYVEKNAEREKVLTQKLDNIMQMKEELARFEKNRNTEQLKHNLSELLEEDRRTYYHIEKAFLSARHRYKLIDQFINQEERLTKKSLLNSWKEKRYNLNVSRAQHFEGCISMAEYISPFPEQKMDTVDNAKKDSTYETLPSVHTCGTAYQSLVDIAPKDFLVLKASVNNSSSSSDKSSYDEASSVPVAGPSRENQMERESASTSASGSPSPGVLTGGVSVASSPLEQCRNPEPFPTTSKSIDVTGEYDIRAKSNQNLHDSSSEDNIDMEHGKSLLYFLANQSVEFPLDAQSRTLRNLLIHNLFIENDLLGHLRRMRTVFLKQDGNGARSLTKILCRNTTIYDPSEFSLHYRLRNIIIQAYPKDYNYFNLKADFLPLAFDSTDPKVFDFLSLEYACSWPLNLVLTETAIQRYCSAWEFLNSIDMTLYYLQEVFEFLRVNHTKLRGDNYKQIQSHRHTMLGFVNSLKYYCGSAVADTWADLRLDLQAEVVRSPEEIYRFHACFLKKVHTKLMLTDATKPIQECLMKALHSVMVYCLTILHVPMEHPTTGQCKHPKFRKLLHTFNNFKVMFEKFQELLAFFISKYGYVHLQILIQPED
uniref:Gamma-tubulin complex component n=1 Tax=Lygus hesperus TaxID=30085 RepID=A0A0A9VUF6_LYGHE